MREIARVLRPGAPLLVAAHRGSQTVHLEELWGIGVRLDFVFFEPQALCGALRGAGFELVEALTRPPYKGVEVETERIYLWRAVPRRRTGRRTGASRGRWHDYLYVTDSIHRAAG